MARAAATIRAIEIGDVVGVEYFDPGEVEDCPGDGVPMLILRSELDSRAADRLARAGRTQAEIGAEWDALYEELLADMPPLEPDVVVPNLPDLPSDRVPTPSEVAALSNAIGRHLNYLKRGEQIEAKRKSEEASKVRAALKREAEEADPEGAAASKRAIALKKAADRQRRWRERQHRKE